MNNQNIYTLSILITLVLFLGKINAQTPCDGTNLHNEENGLLIIEMETGVLSEQWQEGTTLNGYTGDGYIYWSGNQFFGQTGNGVIEYPIKINTAGTYKFTWHMAVGLGNNVTDHNDAWLKIEADDFYGEKVGTGHLVKPRPDCESDPNVDCPMGSSANGFFKVWGQSTNFIWASFTSDNDAHLIYATFDEPGEYKIILNARSSWCLLDRMVLQKVGTVSDVISQDLTTPASDCVEITSTKNLEDKTGFNLSPNPVQNKLNIEKIDGGNISYQIFNVEGKQVHAGQLIDNTTSINVADLKQGIYIFQTNQNNKTQVKRFVKL